MGDISEEIRHFQEAVYGENVRKYIIELAEKLNLIVEQVVVDTDRNVIVGYKTIDPEEYDHKLANINIAAVFAVGAAPNNWTDAPTNNPFTIITTRRSTYFNLQIAFGLSGKPNLYWRTVDRRTHEPEAPGWITDDTPIDTTLSVSGAAADAAMVGLALANRVSKMNAYIDNTLTVGSDNSGGTKGYSSTRLGDNNVASGNRSVAMGNYTEAASENQVVEGKYNIPDANDVYAHIVGNGTGIGGDKSNAATLDWNGNAWFAGNVKAGGTSAASGSELATKDYVDTGLNGKANSGDIPTISTDISADASSDVKTASPKAVKAYADGLLDNAGVFVADGATSTATKINRIGNIVYCTTVVIKQTAFGSSDIPIGTIKNVGQPRTMTLATCYTYNDEGGSSPHPAVVRFVPYTNNTTRVRITPTDANDKRVMINAFYSVADN